MSEHLGKIIFYHVKSHTGKKDYESIHNDIVDKLARQNNINNKFIIY